MLYNPKYFPFTPKHTKSMKKLDTVHFFLQFKSKVLKDHQTALAATGMTRDFFVGSSSFLLNGFDRENFGFEFDNVSPENFGFELEDVNPPG